VGLLLVVRGMWLPVGLLEWARTGVRPGMEVLLASYPLHAGMQDAFVQWWQAEGVAGLLLGAGFVGLMYYFVPKGAERPVFSARLAIVNFWSLVLVSIWAAPRHLHHTGLPDWASSLGMVFGLMLWMPAWAGVVNGMLTLRGAGRRVWGDPALLFFAGAIGFYALWAVEGAVLSIKSVSALVQYTELAQAPAQSGFLGWNALLIFGMAYWLAPRLLQTAGLFSRRLALVHFWLAAGGAALTLAGLYGAGLMQSAMWHAVDVGGNLAHPEFAATLGELTVFSWIRAAGAGLCVLGALLGVFNLAMTWRLGPRVYARPVERAARLERGWTPEALPPSRLGESNVRFARAGDRWLQGAWHRNLEARAGRLTAWVVIVLVGASLAQMAPTLLIPANIPVIASVQPYTPLELAGRDIYIAEGCQACHTQQVRPILAEVKRYGEYSRAGEFVYDRPFLWGSRRIGPDLAREGGRRSDHWHVMHFVWPAQAASGSVMPSYWHLLNERTHFDGLGARVRAMAALGVPYGESVDDAPEQARAQALEVAGAMVEQAGGLGALQEDLAGAASLEDVADLADRRIVALVAFVQRLGVDLSRQAPAENGASASAGGVGAADVVEMVTAAEVVSAVRGLAAGGGR
jgi:cytochrome c oxidase cbb3-type subunit I/II